MQRWSSESAGVIGPEPKNPAACSMVGRSSYPCRAIFREPRPRLSIKGRGRTSTVSGVLPMILAQKGPELLR